MASLRGTPPPAQYSSTDENEAVPASNDTADSNIWALFDDSELSDSEDSVISTTPSCPDEPDNEPALTTFNRLTTQDWPSHKDLIKSINNEAEVLGFGVVIRRSVGKKLPAGHYPRYNLVCIKGRLPVTTSTGKRPKQTSRREGCPFDARAYYNSLTMRWTLKIMNSSHSHIMSSYASNIPVHRRRKRTLDVLSLIYDLSKMPKSTSTDISDQIALQVPGMVICPHDIINEQAKKKKVDLGLRTATQQFLYDLRTDPEVVYRVHRQGNDPEASIDAVFWTYQWCIEKWKQNPHLLSVDNTYSVNRFNMPLFQINGITEVHTTFNVAFCLVSGERQANFEWALANLQELAQQKAIPNPYVLMSDYDRAFKKAASAVFPDDVKQQICRWHVMKNVVYHIKKKWDGPLKGTVIGESGGGCGSRLPDDQSNELHNIAVDIVAGRLANRLLEPQDRADSTPTGDNPRSQRLIPQQPCQPSRKYDDNADGILFAWKAVVYASTEEDFHKAWQILLKEFSAQQG